MTLSRADRGRLTAKAVFASLHLSVDKELHLFQRHHHLNILTCSSDLASTNLLVLGLCDTRGQSFHQRDAQAVPITIKTDLAAEETYLSFANAGSVQHSASRLSLGIGPSLDWSIRHALRHLVAACLNRLWAAFRPCMFNVSLGTNYVHLATLCRQRIISLDFLALNVETNDSCCSQ